MWVEAPMDRDVDLPPPLTKEETEEVFAALPKRWAREKLAAANLRFVKMMAMKMASTGTDWKDLFGAGQIGLMTAVKRFDPLAGYTFLTYARWWIVQAMQNEITDRHTVRQPRNQEDAFRRNRVMQNRLSHERLELVLFEEAQEAAGHGPLMGSDHVMLSADAIGDFAHDNAWDLGTGATDPEQEDDIALRENREMLGAILSRLNDRERDVLTKYYCLDMKLQEIADQYGLTRERVRQIRDQALSRARSRAARAVA